MGAHQTVPLSLSARLGDTQDLEAFIADLDRALEGTSGGCVGPAVPPHVAPLPAWLLLLLPRFLAAVLPLGLWLPLAHSSPLALRRSAQLWHNGWVGASVSGAF